MGTEWNAVLAIVGLVAAIASAVAAVMSWRTADAANRLTLQRWEAEARNVRRDISVDMSRWARALLATEFTAVATSLPDSDVHLTGDRQQAIWEQPILIDRCMRAGENEGVRLINAIPRQVVAGAQGGLDGIVERHERIRREQEATIQNWVVNPASALKYIEAQEALRVVPEGDQVLLVGGDGVPSPRTERSREA